MAKILVEILGDLLPEQPAVTGVLPSPEKLKNKILVKVTHDAISIYSSAPI